MAAPDSAAPAAAAPPAYVDRIVFTGTGTSDGIPRLSCLTRRGGVTCAACRAARDEGPPNRRKNTGCVLRVVRPGREPRYIAIDVGKYWCDAHPSPINRLRAMCHAGLVECGLGFTLLEITAWPHT